MIEIPITTQRLAIRCFEPADLERFLTFMLDKESTRYLAFPADQTTAAGARQLFDAVIDAYDSPDPIHAYAIADLASGKYVGSCGFALHEPGIAECYYSVNRDHRGNGIATEATRALVGALAALVEVRAYCHPENAAAHAVATSCGLQHRGRVRRVQTDLEVEEFALPTL